MRRFLLLLAAGLAPAASAWAETPKAVIVGPSKVAADGLLVLDARKSVADRPLRWTVEGPEVTSFALDQDGRKGVVFMVPQIPPGTYRFTLIARGIPQGEVEIDADAAVWIVTVEAPAPPAPPTPAPVPVPVPVPTPTPPPTPEPAKPPPTTGTLNVSLVVDLGAMTPQIASVREGTKARDAFKSLDAVYRTYPSSSPDLSRLNLAAMVARTGTPCLIVQDASGVVLATEKAPADMKDSLIVRIKSFRGVK